MKLASSSVLHPYFFAIFPIIFLFAYNIQMLSYSDLVLPIAATLGIAFLVWVALSFALKNRIKAGLIVSLGLIIFFTYGHAHNLLQDFHIVNFDIGKHRYLLAPFLATFAIGTWYFIKTGRKLDNVTKIANAISIVLILISLSNVAMFSFSETSHDETTKITNLPTEHGKLPDIYHVVLDGYAGYDVLNNVYDYKNDEFYNFLTNRGFVIPFSHSNYAITALSITSALNMDYLNYLEDELGKENKDQHPLYDLSKDNKVMQILKNYGYKIVIIGSTVDFTTDFKSADVILCGGNGFSNSDFMINLIKTTILKPVYTLLFEGTRDKILCSLDTLPKLHEQYDQPIFVFAHILLPHPPFQFGPNGENIKSELEISDDWDNKKGYVNQVKYANKRMMEIIDQILAEDDPIIVMHGDHGTGSVNNFNPQGSELWQRMTIFNAYHLPGNKTTTPYDGITPVNTYRLIFDSYFNGNYTLLDDRSFFSIHNKPYDFVDVTDRLPSHKTS